MSTPNDSLPPGCYKVADNKDIVIYTSRLGAETWKKAIEDVFNLNYRPKRQIGNYKKALKVKTKDNKVVHPQKNTAYFNSKRKY